MESGFDLCALYVAALQIISIALSVYGSYVAMFKSGARQERYQELPSPAPGQAASR